MSVNYTRLDIIPTDKVTRLRITDRVGGYTDSDSNLYKESYFALPLKENLYDLNPQSSLLVDHLDFIIPFRNRTLVGASVTATLYNDDKQERIYYYRVNKIESYTPENIYMILENRYAVSRVRATKLENIIFVG